ncbi:hypothetical protein [Rhizobium leguminosarum]|uniref:hypothetical protein n=1 Tax=Rhizobium leguminosarum TaxID=384 RepID=UPI0018D5565A|nr:hypothetical protein [Rhizobium leguminosarum]
MKQMIDGIESDMTAEEETSFEASRGALGIVARVEQVSCRQFKLQLLADGLLDQVDAWVAAQSKAVQIAYEYSGTFVKDSPMMTAGFAAMGFTSQQIDAFFEAAARL